MMVGECFTTPGRQCCRRNQHRELRHTWNALRTLVSIPLISCSPRLDEPSKSNVNVNHVLDVVVCLKQDLL